MAKTGGAVQKLRGKASRQSAVRAVGSNKPMIARTTTPFNDKALAYSKHKELLDNHVMIGAAETFRGDGLPDEVIVGSKNWPAKPKKAKEDKRNSLRSEWREGYVVSREYQRQADAVELALAALVE